MSASPLLSIVIVCKNPGARLRTALESIWMQQGADPEIIVIDGASTDGSREWLETQHSRLHTFVSAPDRGLYDAMNKGIAAARGEWVLFLGADDRLAGDTVLRETLVWLGQTDAGVVAGEAAYDDGRIYRFRAQANPVARNFVHHQSAFYRRTLFSENSNFDATLSVMADYDFNLRLWKSGVRFKPIPLRIAACGIAGVSDAGRWRGYREEIAVRHRYFPAWRCWLWDAGSMIRFLRKKIVRAIAKP